MPFGSGKIVPRKKNNPKPIPEAEVKIIIDEAGCIKTFPIFYLTKP
jgi:hypothetical protein